MNGSNMRDKARAIFGKTFFENTKEPAPAKNAAVALQKRANARPIPTYKVGGVVKKQAGGALTAAEKARAQAMIKERGDAAMRDPLVMRYLDEQNRAPMPVPGMGPKAATKRAEGGRMGVPVNPRAYSAVGSRDEPKTISRRAEGGDIEAQRLEARAAAGRYKDGGKITKKASGGMTARSDRDVIVAVLHRDGFVVCVFELEIAGPTVDVDEHLGLLHECRRAAEGDAIRVGRDDLHADIHQTFDHTEQIKLTGERDPQHQIGRIDFAEARAKFSECAVKHDLTAGIQNLERL